MYHALCFATIFIGRMIWVHTCVLFVMWLIHHTHLHRNHKITTHINIFERMDNTTSQCPNCHQWFTNKQILRLHILSCWPKHSAEEQGHAPFWHHPLKSSSYHGGKIDKTTLSHNHADYDVDTVDSGDRSDDDFIESWLLDYDYCNGNDYDPQGEQSTAVSKM